MVGFAVLVTRYHLCLIGVSSCRTVCLLQRVVYRHALSQFSLLSVPLITGCEEFNDTNQY